MSLNDTREVFERLGKDDPLWAVLSVRSKEGGKWDPEEFFATGRREIDSAIAYLDDKGFHVQRQTALDFGCGVGRLTQALAEHFDEVTGVDIAQPMVDHAQQFNQYGERCRFVVNTAPDLGCFADASFDFIYSNIVLQHMPPDNARRYVREFIRLLRPQGIALFNVPDHRVMKHRAGSIIQRLEQWRYERFRPWWKRVRGKQVIPMNGIPREQIEQILLDAGTSLLDVVEYDPTKRGPKENRRGWVKYRYCVRKT